MAASGLNPVDYAWRLGEVTGSLPASIYMLSIVRDEALDLPTRLDAAKAVAPYTNPRLSVIDSTVRTEVNVMALTDEQRRERARQAILEAFAERPPVVVEGARRKCGRQTIRRMATRLNSARVEGTAPTSVRFMGLSMGRSR